MAKSSGFARVDPLGRTHYTVGTRSKEVVPMRRSMLGSVLAVVMLVAASGAAFADPDIGCGLGTQIWTGSKGIAPKVLGATTNGTSGSQTFGISSGTIGCHQGGTVTADAKVQIFTGANLDRLARDMAQGGGETLDAF